MEVTLVNVVIGANDARCCVMEEVVLSPFPFVVVVIYTIITFTFIIVLNNAFTIGSKIDNSVDSVDFVGNCIDLATFNIMGVVNVVHLYCNFIVEVVVLKNHNLIANATVVITKEVVTKVNYINP